MTTYAQQPNWRAIQNFLPAELQLTDEEAPQETWWQWHQHRVHLDCYRIASARLKVILLHGLGTNGRQLSVIVGAPLARAGFETIAVDMPEYGLTEVGPGKPVTYDDWVQAGSDLVDLEAKQDDRPIVLYGFSAGGLETFHIAAKNRKVKGIIGMGFFDPRLRAVRDQAVQPAHEPAGKSACTMDRAHAFRRVAPARCRADQNAGTGERQGSLESASGG